MQSILNQMPSTSLGHKVAHCIIIATYNNDKTLQSVITRTLAVCKDVIIINDGSTDNTPSILNNNPAVHLISYQINRGKGHALSLGFKKAMELGFDYAITIDSDGQHYPEDIPKLVDKLQANVGKLIMGSRNMSQADVPNKSSFGNKFSNFWFWAETGIKLSDTQTGFRAYPLKKMSNMYFFTQKFEFEIEIIVRLAWHNVQFAEVPVRVNYPKDRVSHFRPFKDFARISVLNTVLVVLAYLFYLPRLIVLNFSAKKIGAKLKTEFLKDINHPFKLASAVGLGLFFGILPIWGFQMMTAFAVASYFKLNKALVLLVSNISIPPMIPLIVFVSFKLGSWFVKEPVSFVAINQVDSQTIYLQLKQYIIGSSLLAVFLGLVGFAIVLFISVLTKWKRK